MQQLTNYFRQLTYKLFPQLNNQPPVYQKQAVMAMTFFFYLVPYFVLGTLWLLFVTEWTLIGEQWGIFLFLLVLTIALDLRQYVLPIVLTESVTLPVTTSLSNIISTAALLIFGPTFLWVVWLNGLLTSIYFGWQDGRQAGHNPFTVLLNSVVQSSGTNIVILLLATAVYTTTGGQFPFDPAVLAAWLPAILCLLTISFSPVLIYLVAMIAVIREMGLPMKSDSFMQLTGGPILMTLLTVPFALPLALTYDSQNLTIFIFLNLGIGLANMLAYFLSQHNLLAQARTRELATLETISEALITAPADGSTLQSILAKHLPKLFPNDFLVIHLFPPEADDPAPIWPFTLEIPDYAPPVVDALWQRLRQADEPALVDRKVAHPGNKASFGNRFLIKILLTGDAELPRCVGGIYLQRPPSKRKPEQVLPTLQELASQIGSALYRAQTHQETLQRQKMAQELAFAGRIQQSFLPNEIPRHPNWDFAATLIPARETSGDFYDFVPLSNGRLGLVVADVADKGTGAALYMALSRTLIRTYAMQFPDEPGKALQLANERILLDTETDQFVTVFYGVLDLVNGRFTYANAGHNPTYHLGPKVQSLAKTGIPLGMFEEMDWQQETIQIGVGESLILYSDGVPEAQNSKQEEFGDARMLAIAQQKANGSATIQQTAIANAVSAFVGDAPQFDDITLMVATRLK